MPGHSQGIGKTAAIPVRVGSDVVYLSLDGTGIGSAQAGPGEESEVASRHLTLDRALDGLVALTRAVGARLRETDAAKATIEFGCEFALESGTLVTVVGKASSKSSFKVSLEWERAT